MHLTFGCFLLPEARLGWGGNAKIGGVDKETTVCLFDPGVIGEVCFQDLWVEYICRLTFWLRTFSGALVDVCVLCCFLPLSERTSF